MSGYVDIYGREWPSVPPSYPPASFIKPAEPRVPLAGKPVVVMRRRRTMALVAPLGHVLYELLTVVKGRRVWVYRGKTIPARSFRSGQWYIVVPEGE